MTTNEPWELQLAWQRAWQLRGCPPDSRLLTAEPDDRLAEHLNRCPFCREHREAGPATAAALRNIAARLAGLKCTCQAHGHRPSPAPGQIWSIRQDLAGWGPKGRYYNPPRVLVVACPESLAGALRVAQLFDEPRLAGAGDVPLAEEWLAESWNTYTLAEEDLHACLGSVSEEELDSVRRSEQEPFPTVADASHLAAFRRLELEVGAFFSMAAVARLVARQEAGLFAMLSAKNDLLQTIGKRLVARHPKLEWPDGEFNHLESVALARLPAYELPLAAATDARHVPVNLLHVRTEVFLEPRTAEITVWDVRRDGLVVGGRIVGDLPAGTELYARWQRPDGSLVAPSETMMDPAEGFFRLRFTAFAESEMPAGQLHLLLGAP
jgi:hypothetical protein